MSKFKLSRQLRGVGSAGSIVEATAAAVRESFTTPAALGAIRGRIEMSHEILRTIEDAVRASDVDVDTRQLFLDVYGALYGALPAHEQAYLGQVYDYLQPQMKAPSLLSRLYRAVCCMFRAA